MRAVVAKNLDWSKVEQALENATQQFSEEAEPQAPPQFTYGRGFASAASPQKVTPGVTLLVGSGGEVIYHAAFGCRSLQPAKTELKLGMVYDIASLTKVLITTTLAMQLVEEGLLNIDWRLSRIFQSFATHGKETMTVKHLLTHMSGYPATVPYYKYISKADTLGRSGVMTARGATEMVYSEIFRGKLDNMPGKVTKYSDLGFILLGHAVEILTGHYLEKLAIKNVIRPLGLTNTGYIDLEAIKRHGIEPVVDSIVPTARCTWRGKILCGEVHDDNAWAMGGVAAHAGIFSDAIDLHRFATEMIRCYWGSGGLVSQEVMRKFWTRAGDDSKSSWALGWDTPSEGQSSSGKYFSPSSVGHLGFTGCSLWIDPERELDVILLTNRVHPSAENNLIREFRPQIHDLIMQTLGYGN